MKQPSGPCRRRCRGRCRPAAASGPRRRAGPPRRDRARPRAGRAARRRAPCASRARSAPRAEARAEQPERDEAAWPFAPIAARAASDVAAPHGRDHRRQRDPPRLWLRRHPGCIGALERHEPTVRRRAAPRPRARARPRRGARPSRARARRGARAAARCRSASRTCRRRAGAVRTHRFSGGARAEPAAQPRQRVVQQRGAGRAVVLEARRGRGAGRASAGTASARRTAPSAPPRRRSRRCARARRTSSWTRSASRLPPIVRTA